MTTSSQLPVVQNIDLLMGSASTIPIALGMDISQASLQATAYMDAGQAQREDSFFISSTHPLPLSITNAWTGDVVISFSRHVSFVLRNGGSWDLRATGVSAEDPPELVRTLRWGRVSVSVAAELPSSSPLYHAVEMVSGDEFTFQVNLGTSLSGIQLSASLVNERGYSSSALPVSVVSESQGIVKVTIDEAASGAAGSRDGWSWVLLNSQSQSVLRAGPVVAYTRRRLAGTSSPPIGETTSVPAAPAQIGSVFL